MGTVLQVRASTRGSRQASKGTTFGDGPFDTLSGACVAVLDAAGSNAEMLVLVLVMVSVLMLH